MFELLSRVVTFSLERHWIDYIAYVMENYLPQYDKFSGLSRMSHILFVSFVLMAIIELFRVMGTQYQERKLRRMETQLLLLQSQQSK